MVVNFATSCTIGGWHHGGMNMRRLGVGHPKDPTSELKGGFASGSPLDELPQGESPSCPPFGGWWSKPLGIWIGKLIITYTMVDIDVIIGY